MSAVNTSSFPRLMGDVGGTNARFALQEAPGAQPSQVRTYAVSGHANIDGAMKAYLEQVAGPKPRQGAVGIANPIVGDFLRMTNSPWAFSIEGLRVARRLLDRYEELWRERVERMDQLISGSPEVGDR